ncbi:uncharacterized protein ACIQIH_011324 isoform 2-T5 [Cyanocitta cristata]
MFTGHRLLSSQESYVIKIKRLYFASLQEMEQSRANRKEWQGVNCDLIIKARHSQGTDNPPSFQHENDDGQHLWMLSAVLITLGSCCREGLSDTKVCVSEHTLPDFVVGSQRWWLNSPSSHTSSTCVLWKNINLSTHEFIISSQQDGPLNLRDSTENKTDMKA